MKTTHMPKIDLRVVSSTPSSGCPFVSCGCVICGNNRTKIKGDKKYQYVCICKPKPGFGKTEKQERFRSYIKHEYDRHIDSDGNSIGLEPIDEEFDVFTIRDPKGNILNL